ncbi:MAG: HlyD family efflux transporter periplasmic adaptor subunit [Chitinophagales bacterium]|nr:HlyD family efflux transporter periplasmic adaptor subunit [Chitinophagales bacterium]
MENIQRKIELASFKYIYRINKQSNIRYWFVGIIIVSVVILLLPWTQNIKTKGKVTTLYQEQRPQEVHSPIPGKIVKWHVKEGDFVKKGDTILQISEIKEDYLDPNLVARTQQQVNAKKGSIQYYQGKIVTTGTQIEALTTAKQLKIEQLKNKLGQLENKLAADKAELDAVTNEYLLSKDQYERQQKMYEEGLVSQTQLQQRNIAFQNVQAKKTMVENKIAQTKQEITNAKIEQNSIEQEYLEKITKAEGDRYQSLSQIATSEGDVAKLENAVTNYTIRNGMYVILAPQDGQIVQANKTGIGEILKEGEQITVIVPDKVNYAVELFVRPVDLPLISVGQEVRLMFDGFPAIVFSGWPNSSYGTFSGRIIAFENTISDNGMFRILVSEDTASKKWPAQIKVGSGVQGIALLKDVPIWYEVWRNINGFPPDYYQYSNEDLAKKQKK